MTVLLLRAARHHHNLSGRQAIEPKLQQLCLASVGHGSQDASGNEKALLVGNL